MTETKKYGIYAVVAVVLFVGGYAAGKFTTTPKVVEKEKVVTQVKTQIQYQDRVVEKKVYVQAKKQHQVSTTTTQVQKDGTKVITQTTTTDTDTNTNVKSDKDENKDGQTVKQEDKVVQKETKTTQQPDWHVSLGVGVNLSHFLGSSPDVGVPGLNGVVIQGSVERRILGPFHLGVWGNTMGAVGLSAGASF